MASVLTLRRPAGKHALGVLSLVAGLPGGPEAIAEHWKIGGDGTKHGKTLDRDKGGLVVNVLWPRMTSSPCARCTRASGTRP